MKSDEKTKKKGVRGLIIKKYQQYLELEKSLFKNTLGAYLTDLDKLLSFLSDEGVDILEISLKDLQRFAVGLYDIDIHARSQARIIPSIKSFFYFLIVADYMEVDPSELLKGPKIDFRLPKVLAVKEISHIISTVDLGKNEGQRNRAVLETLYSCDLRVLELTNLKLSDLYFNEGFIKVKGEGSKQRLVSISPRATQGIKHCFMDRNRINIKEDYEDYLFLSRQGTYLPRIIVFHLIKELADMVGTTKSISPHTFRRSFATHLLEGGASLGAI